MKYLTELPSKENRSMEIELKIVNYLNMITKIGKILTRNLDVELGFTFVEPYFNRFLQLSYWTYINSKLFGDSNFDNRLESIYQELNDNMGNIHGLLTKEIENLENDNSLTEGGFDLISSQIRNLNATLVVNLSELSIAGLVQSENKEGDSKIKREKKKYLIEFVDSKNNIPNTARSLMINNLRIEIITSIDYHEGTFSMQDSLEYTLWNSLTNFKTKSLINESLKSRPRALILVLTYTKFGYHILDNIFPGLPKNEFTIEKSIDKIFELQNNTNTFSEIPLVVFFDSIIFKEMIPEHCTFSKIIYVPTVMITHNDNYYLQMDEKKIRSKFG
jgi:hypothetical protein